MAAKLVPMMMMMMMMMIMMFDVCDVAVWRMKMTMAIDNVMWMIRMGRRSEDRTEIWRKRTGMQHKK